MVVVAAVVVTRHVVVSSLPWRCRPLVSLVLASSQRRLVARAAGVATHLPAALHDRMQAACSSCKRFRRWRTPTSQRCRPCRRGHQPSAHRPRRLLCSRCRRRLHREADCRQRQPRPCSSPLLLHSCSKRTAYERQAPATRPQPLGPVCPPPPRTLARGLICGTTRSSRRWAWAPRVPLPPLRP